MSRHSPKEIERIKRIGASADFGKPVTQGSFAATTGWSVRPENMKENSNPMKAKPNDIITVESEDGILHEMIVKSVDQNNRTVTGEVAHWTPPDPRARFSNAPCWQPQRIVETITVPDHAIRERP